MAGVKISEVYETGVKYVKDEKPEMIDHLTKHFGFAMGIEFRESSLLIGPKTHATLKKGMVFNVNVGLANLMNSEAIDKEGKTYALFIGDTVMINEVLIYMLQTLYHFFFNVSKNGNYIKIIPGTTCYKFNTVEEKGEKYWNICQG